ncbi:MAG: hypothetical protein ACAI35_19615 [Candidatus Methylacidiphilales bacterium]
MSISTPASTAPAQYYIRWRGSQRGPYTAEQVLELLQQGQISMYHEVNDGSRSLTVQELQESVQVQHQAVAEALAQQKAEQQRQRQSEYEAQLRHQSEMQRQPAMQPQHTPQPQDQAYSPQVPAYSSAPEPRRNDAIGAIAQRLFRADFYFSMPTVGESQALEQAGAGDAPLPIQNYLAWRRTILMLSATLLSIITIWSFLFVFILNDFPDSLGNHKLPTLLMHMGAFSVVACLFCAAIKWSTFGESFRFTRYAIFIVYAGSLFLLGFGLFYHMNDKVLTWEPVRVMYFSPFCCSIVFSVAMLPFVLLKVCMTLKKIMPESATPGWILLTIIPPYYAILLLSIVATTITSLTTNREALLFIIPFVFLATGFYIVFHNLPRFFRNVNESEAFQFVSTLQLQYLGTVFLAILSFIIIAWLMQSSGLPKAPDSMIAPVFMIVFTVTLYYGIHLMLYVALLDFALQWESYAINTRTPDSNNSITQKLEALALLHQR